MSVSVRIQNLFPTMNSLSDTMTSLLNNVWSVPQLWSGMYKYVPNLHSLMRLFPREPGPLEIRRYLYFADGESTFQYDDGLPALPVPDLRHTLDVYLESCKPYLTEEELEQLGAVLKEFEAGMGTKLHAKLLEKAAKEKNWLEKWWEEEVYLKLRLPLIPYLYMCAEGPRPKELTEDFDFAPLAICLHYTVKFWFLMRQGKIKPQKQMRKDMNDKMAKPFSMHQFRRFFNTARVPKKGKDEIQCYFATEEEDPNNEVPTNMIVLYRGYLYSVQVADLDAGEIMTPHDMEAAMNWIIADARGRLPTIGPSVAALTCDERDAWAENRERLKALSPANAAILHEIESSLFGWSLQEDKPETESDVLKKLICDGIRDRWADKSFTCMLFKNGCTGNSSDHTPIDAMVNSTIALYVTLSFRALGGEWPAERVSRTIWPDPRRLDFVIDEKLETDIARILRGSQALSSTINCKLSHFREFGKGVLKVYGTHPDAFVQAAIQLTYHRMHGKPGSAYETATTRQFYHGRTETCRTCTLETVDFAKAMDDVDTEETTKWNLLKKSLDKHQQLMRKAQGNMGCDRHMFGMQMIAKENGMFDQLVGEVFGPGAWTKSGGDGQFKLSTSLLGYTPMTGGMVAMCAEGYGVFYSIEDDCINYAVSNWVGAGTDHEEFSRVFEDSLLDMERLAACNYSAPL